MATDYDKVNEASEYVKRHFDQLPRVGILTGTGLGDSVSPIKDPIILEYSDIPHFPVSTVQSHMGNLIYGSIAGTRVLAFQGRFHLYEGYSPADVAFPIRVMQALGIPLLILSNAAGGFNPDFKPGDIMIISDHINLTGENPLAGAHDERWGIRFPDMAGAYNPELAGLAEQAALESGITLKKGIYAGLKGPSLETPAEVRFLKIIGAEAVGFSTVQEVIVAAQAGMRVLGLSTITNINNPDRPVPATVDEIIAVAEKASLKLAGIIEAVIRSLKEHGTS